MADLYAALIINNQRTFSSVPTLLKEKVRQILIAIDLEELTQE